jgi:hypothetical protein
MQSDISTNDIKTFGDLEKRLYGIKDAVTFFQRDIQKCTPFSKKTIKVEKTNGSSNFGYTHAFIIDNERGHYLSNVFLIISLPGVKLNSDNTFKDKGRLRWCKNIMHNIIESITLSFNDQLVSKLDSFSLDFLSEFETEEGKYKKYMENIGNIPELITPQKELKPIKLVLPIPFFFSKDSGANIPLFALKRTEIKITITYRNWESLLIFENESSLDTNIKVPHVKIDIPSAPEIHDANLYSTVTWVSELELTEIGKPTTMLIENLQSTPRQSIHHQINELEVSLFFKNAIRCIYFGVSNTTFKNEKSNYVLGHDNYIGGIFNMNSSKKDVLKRVAIKYGDQIREDMDIECYRFIQPYLYGKRISSQPGMYLYSFAMDNNFDPSGSTNIHRIPGSSIKFYFNEYSSQETMEIVIIGVSHTIANISDGLIEIPVFS